MTYDPDKHHRRSIRLQGYDYARAGAYFVTIVTQARACLFGEVVDGTMRLNHAGRMVETVWDELPLFYPGVDIDAFAIMPNHIHGIIVLVGAAPRGRPGDGEGTDRPWGNRTQSRAETGQARGPAPTDGCPDSEQRWGPATTGRGLSLGDVVHRFKTMTTKRYVDGVKQSGWPPFPTRLWQRNYYEHIIRDQPALDRIRCYIDDNPLQWAFDDENPQRATSCASS